MVEAVIPRVRRKKTSIYVDGDLWRDFVGWCKDRHTSTCHIVEPLIYALMKGVSEVPAFSPLPKVEMNLSINREVLRARRREVVGKDGPVWSDWGTHLRCHFCHRRSKWVVRYLEGWDKGFRVYACGYHVKQYKRMVSRERGFPQISFQVLYK